MDNIATLIMHLETLVAEDYRVRFNDYADDWVDVTVLYDKIVDGVQKELQATFKVHWISEHLWYVEVYNCCASWQVVMEINPIAAFQFAVGFEFVNE